MSLLGVLLLVAVGRLLYWTVQCVRTSLQMDFSAFYTAGQAMNRGLSPYVNYVGQEQALWDGVARYQHSRFLYPPLAALLFAPIAHLPYAEAKSLWSAIGLACSGMSLVVAAAIVGFHRISPRSWMLIGIGSALFFPLFTLLERGQIDSVVLLLLMVTFAIVIKGSPRRQVVGGLLLGIATLLKLHVLFILPILIVRKKFRVALSYVITLGVMGVLSVVAVPDLTLDYVAHQLPRISIYGEGGEPGMLLAPERLAAAVTGLPEGKTVKDGDVYNREAFHIFFWNATLVRVIRPVIERAGVKAGLTGISVGVFASLFVALLLRQVRPNLHSMKPDPAVELLYWSLALIIILLSAPQTWVMNVVWLLPLILLTITEAPRVRSNLGRLCLVLWAASIALAAVPDHLIVALIAPAPPHFALGWRLASAQYVLAELILLVSIAAYIRLVSVKQQVSADSLPHPCRSVAGT